MKHNRGIARMFDSDFIEFFSKVHPATPALLYLPASSAFVYLAATRYGLGVADIAWRFFLGYFLWTLSEYWLHRVVFHMNPNTPFMKRVHFILHGVHHDYPWDHYRLVMPVVPGLIGATLFLSLFYLLVGERTMFAWAAGFMVGYVIYDSVHWYTHAGKPSSRLFKFLRREHMVHHFKEPETRFGVSCPWWDVVFRTTGNKTSEAEAERAVASA